MTPTRQRPENSLSATAHRERWGWPEWFIIIQFLSPALLFLPGAQSFRFVIRALPYVTSLGLLLLLIGHAGPAFRSAGMQPEIGPRLVHPSRAWLIAALLLVLVNQLHGETVQPAGVAQLIFQLTIAAPLFWASRTVRTIGRLQRIIWVVFLSNALSASVGLLQVYDPDRFLPPEFSRVGREMNPFWIEALSYTGASGKRIIRPPGLTDMPGGAALAGMIIGFLGVLLAIQPREPVWRRGVCLALAGMGMCVLYLTQVRSLFLMMLLVILGMAVLLWKRGRRRISAALVLIGTALVAGAFQWATLLGGESVAERFLTLKEEDPLETYKRHRGHFLDYTVNDLLSEYPFGAGVGRWGMMNVYFQSKDPMAPQPIHVEIQLTGWLIDGGILMWVLYGGAILVAMLALGKMALHPGKTDLPYLAGIVFCFNLGVVVQAFAGPAFNTQLGIQFWFLTAVLHGAFVFEESELTRTIEVRPQPEPIRRIRRPTDSGGDKPMLPGR